MRDMVNVSRPSGDYRYSAPEMRMGRSQFDLTHSHKTTFDADLLIPYFCREVLPGDTQTLKMLAFARVFSPLDAPIMDDIMIEIDFFFVPNRIIWSNWEAFLGAHDAAGAQDVDYTIPILADGATVALGDANQYMGLPIGMQTTPTEVSALPQRAYQKIYNEWYRDQNLQAMVASQTPQSVPGDGPDTMITGCASSGKKHDYFTSALPYVQKGDPVSVVASGLERVRTPIGINGTPSVWSDTASAYQYFDSSGAVLDLLVTPGSIGDRLYVDMSAVTITVNALREAEAVQRLLERDARGGTRHPEIIRAHFGVEVPDYRLQRPEYLGGGKGFINVSPVATTAVTATRDVGELAGTGTGMLKASWAKSFTEHGYVLGILRARGQISYQQGVDRMWSRSTKLDFLWPELANLGEQPIYKRELFIENDATDDEVFGYQERYGEYRWARSLVTGKFASDAAGSLDFWHLAEDFAAAPALNSTFIVSATPMARVTTVDSEPDFIIDGRFDYKVARALPVRALPSLLPARF